MNKKSEDKITGLLNDGVNANVFPGAVLLVALKGEIVFLKEAGFLSAVPPRIRVEKDSIYDLASLTKPLATTLAFMGLVDQGIISLDQSLNEILSYSVPADKQAVTVRLLLNHSSGLPDWKPYYSELVKYSIDKRKEILRRWILDDPLLSLPGTGSLYSDLGFMLLEWIIEECSGMKMNEYLSRAYYSLLNLRRTFLIQEKASFSINEIAATEDCPWRKRVIHGEVHDDNAYALGGYSGHAGLFGTAAEVFEIANMLRGHYFSERQDFFKPETVREFFRRQDIVKNSTWALGWDTPSSSGSSSGDYFSEKSIGHLGYTGTSIWMDMERDIAVIFLCNRVHPTRENTKIRLFRPKLHNFIMNEFSW